MTETMTTPTPTPNPAAALLQIWSELFPAIAQRLPLAIGVHKLLQAEFPELSGVMIRRALARHTTRPGYLTALATPGAQRHGLDGSPVAPVSEVHRHVAADRLEKLKARRQTAAKPQGKPQGKPQVAKPMPAVKAPQAAHSTPRTGRATLSLKRTA